MAMPELWERTAGGLIVPAPKLIVPDRLRAEINADEHDRDFLRGNGSLGDGHIARARDGRPIRAVDVFAGCGGFSLGMQQAGIDVIAPCSLDSAHVGRGERHSNGEFAWALRGKETKAAKAGVSANERPRDQCPLLYVDPHTGAPYEPHLCCQREGGHEGRCSAVLPESGADFEWRDTWDINPKRQQRNIAHAKRDHKEAGLMVKAKTKKTPASNIPHEAGCACGPCHNDRTRERGTAPQKKLPPEACGVPDGDRGRRCTYKKGHEGYHFTGQRLFRDAAPAAPKAKSAKKPAKKSPPTSDDSAVEHQWEKTNLFTKVGRGPSHDTYRCTTCGATSKRISVAWPPKLDAKQPKNCKVIAAAQANLEPVDDVDEDDRAARWECGASFADHDGRERKCEGRNEHNGSHYAFCRVLDRTVHAPDPTGTRNAPMTLADEPEDPEGDAVALDAMRQHEERYRRSYDEAREALDLDAAELAELREMERAAEERLDGELEIGDLRAVLEQYRMKLAARPGRSRENGKRTPAMKPPTDGAINESGHMQTGRASGLKHPLERLFSYRRHVAGAIWSFADLEGEDLAKVVANLKERDAAAKAAGLGEGQALINPVVLVEDTDENGMREWFVLDGWNRLRACELAGVRPRFVNYVGRTDIDALLDYVDAVNDKRRHTTPSQRAAVAAEAEGLRQGQRANGTTKTQAERAAEKGISDRLLRRAEKVKEGVTPKTWEAVKRGKVAIDAALDAIDLPAAKQDELADRALAGDKEMKAGKFRALARQEKKRDVVQRINKDLVRPMPMGPFGLIVVDYPWKFENSDQHEGSRGHTPYPPMTMPEIHAHAAEATKRADDDCVLGLWVTDAHLPEVFGVIESWGFRYQCPIVWDKVHVGMGIAGPRHLHELLILAYKGKPQHTLNDLTSIIRSPRESGHSKKPALVYEQLAKNCAGRRLELFAVGDEREGWECWGAEAGKPDATSRPQKKSKILTETDARASQGAA